MSSYAIETKNIDKNFTMGDAVSHVLRDVSIGITMGEFVSIMGASGSGKSTLLYILGGLDNPTSGNVFMNGRDISEFDDKKRALCAVGTLVLSFSFTI